VPGNERMFMINGAASCVEVQGGVGRPAVLLVGSSMLSWPDELCRRLVAGGRRVIRYDVRDTGRSESYPPGEPGYSLADLVDDAVGVLDATATERAHVVGMSTGGWIAQLLALGHPERVATLTLIASRPNAPGPVDDDLPGHDDALMEVIMNTPEPDWSWYLNGSAYYTVTETQVGAGTWKYPDWPGMYGNRYRRFLPCLPSCAQPPVSSFPPTHSIPRCRPP
jgi:pimeloyl-ACP methyl ester carboxylesterase